MLLMPLCAIILGLGLLVFSADRFTSKAVLIAQHFGISQMMIGLTIVAFGTSAPEIIVSINAALADAGNIALGNAIGSNLTNTGLVLGVTALVLPISCQWLNLRVEFTVLLLISLLGAACIADGRLSRIDGFALLAALVLCSVWIVRAKIQLASTNPQININNSEAELPQHQHHSIARTIALFIVYLSILIISANILVWGAKQIAMHLGISELVIGLTIVAIGTSLPELAASLASALKGHHDIALGGIIGSNIFNVGAVLGIAGAIKPFQTSEQALSRDYCSMILITVLLGLLLLIARHQSKSNKLVLGRIAGVMLLLTYIAYGLLLVSQST